MPTIGFVCRMGYGSWSYAGDRRDIELPLSSVICQNLSFWGAQAGSFFNDEATARIMKRDEHIEWLRKLFAGWKEARPALRESRRRRDK